MYYLKCFYIIVLIVFILFCSKKREINEIIISDSTKQKIEKQIPPEDYSLLALKDSLPASIEEIAGFNLIVICNYNTEDHIRLIESTIKDYGIPFFRSTTKYFINTSLISGKLSMRLKQTVEYEDGKNLIVEIYNKTYSKDTPIDTLIQNSVSEMYKMKSVLLISNNMKSILFDQMVEIIFSGGGESRDLQHMLSVKSPIKLIERSGEFSSIDEYPKIIGGYTALQKKLKYPVSAKNTGIEGKVIIQVTINKAGQVVETKIVRSVQQDLDKAAIAAIRSVKWMPAKSKGNPVTANITFPVTFRLD